MSEKSAAPGGVVPYMTINPDTVWRGATAMLEALALSNATSGSDIPTPPLPSGGNGISSGVHRTTYNQLAVPPFSVNYSCPVTGSSDGHGNADYGTIVKDADTLIVTLQSHYLPRTFYIVQLKPVSTQAGNYVLYYENSNSFFCITVS